MKACPTCKGTYATGVDYCPRDGTPLESASDWADGVVIRGKYRILTKLGEGGMAVVFKALHVRFDELRALKVMKPELAVDSQFVKRFMHEAVITRRLQHPNAVHVEDVDEAEDGRPFMVMEYIEGLNLKDVLQQRGSLPVSRACDIAKQVAAALDAAHNLGIIHRDVKPSNIVLAAPDGHSERTALAGNVKVLDFGIAKLKEPATQKGPHLSLTGTGVYMGTPAYMSPEQARGLKGDQIDCRSDLYSLGVVMYQMLGGELPFSSANTIELLMAHIQTPPPPIRSQHPEIPAAVADLVMSCLEKEPERRPQSARTLIEEIERAKNMVASIPAAARIENPNEPLSQPKAPPVEGPRAEGEPSGPLVPIVPALIIQATQGKARVYLDHELGGETGPDGRLDFHGLTAGEHHIRLTLPGYRDYEEVVRVGAGTTARLNPRLVPQEEALPAPSAVHAARHTQPFAGKGVSIATAVLIAVLILGAGFLWWTSAHSPRVVAPAGVQPTTKDAGQTTPLPSESQPQGTEPAPTSGPPTPAVTAATGPDHDQNQVANADAEVTGLVVDEHGTPLAGAVVSLKNLTPLRTLQQTTGADGRYTFDAVKPATGYFLAASAGQRRPARSANFDLHAGETYTPTSNLILGTQGNAKVTGLVLDPNGRPIPGAKVSLENRSGGWKVEQPTDAGGRFIFREVKPANGYYLSATAVGFEPYVSHSEFNVGIDSPVLSRPAIVLSPSTVAVKAIAPEAPPTAIAVETLPTAIAQQAPPTAPAVKLTDDTLKIKSGKSKELIVTNKGNAPLKIESVSITGTNANDFTKNDSDCIKAPLAPGGTCHVTVGFKPHKLPGTQAGNATESEKATLEIRDNASNSPQTVKLLSAEKILGIF